MRKTLPTLAILAALAAGLSLACDEDDSAQTASISSAAAQAKLPDGLILTSAPEGARGVRETRDSASDGEMVVVRGIVGGREEPIAPNRAILTLLDESVQTCDRMEMSEEGCQTPWDACCTAPEEIAANSLAVQVVDGEGRVLQSSLAGGGLKPLSRVVVVGKYRPSPDGQAANIEASGIFVEG